VTAVASRRKIVASRARVTCLIMQPWPKKIRARLSLHLPPKAFIVAMSSDLLAQGCTSDDGANVETGASFHSVDAKTQQELRDLQALRSLARGHASLAATAPDSARAAYQHCPDVEIHAKRGLIADLHMDMTISLRELDCVARCAAWVKSSSVQVPEVWSQPESLAPSSRSSKEEKYPHDNIPEPHAKNCFNFCNSFPWQNSTKKIPASHEIPSKKAGHMPILKKRSERSSLSRQKSYIRRTSTSSRVSIFSARSKQKDKEDDNLLLALEACMFNIWRDNQLCALPEHVVLTSRDYKTPKKVEFFPTQHSRISVGNYLIFQSCVSAAALLTICVRMVECPWSTPSTGL
jgi:hypothetical protein